MVDCLSKYYAEILVVSLKIAARFNVDADVDVIQAQTIAYVTSLT
jgi:hypothetical protein